MVKRITVEDKSTPKTHKPAQSVAKVKPRPLMKVTKANRPRIKIENAEIVQKPSTPEAKAKTEEPTPTPTTQERKAIKNTMHLPKLRILHLKTRYVLACIIILFLAIFIGRVAIWEDNYLSAMEGSERDVPEENIEEFYGGGEEVNNEEPTIQEVYEYHVAANRPRYIRITKAGIYQTRIIEIGLTASGALATPSNIYDAGWYNGSPLPGQVGTTVIDAHGGDLGSGIFKYLQNLNPGDTIEIEMGDENTIYTYTITELVKKDIGSEANAYMSKALNYRSDVPALTLITCTGDWWQTSQTYSHRLFVHAVLTSTATKV